MKRFIEGVERTQGTLSSAQLDEYIAEANRARVIDAFIDTLNLGRTRQFRIELRPSGTWQILLKNSGEISVCYYSE